MYAIIRFDILIEKLLFPLTVLVNNTADTFQIWDRILSRLPILIISIVGYEINK